MMLVVNLRTSDYCPTEGLWAGKDTTRRQTQFVALGCGEQVLLCPFGSVRLAALSHATSLMVRSKRRMDSGMEKERASARNALRGIRHHPD
ncbi:hypothetical protein QQF64_028608 [Cirrhinus molitorella]|uniref:Uncharacterized protein n=1 Tax=Cirrhinus molitorella TaxID=172907 RepID=A0ABR3N7D2_9TELE